MAPGHDKNHRNVPDDNAPGRDIQKLAASIAQQSGLASDHWAALLCHPTDISRPVPGKFGLSPAEISYKFCLNVLKRGFLTTIGDYLLESQGVKAEVVVNGPLYEEKGYALVIPRNILRLRGEVTLAAIGLNDSDLGFYTNSPTVASAMDMFAPFLQHDVAKLEKKKSDLPRLYVYVRGGMAYDIANRQDAELAIRRK